MWFQKQLLVPIFFEETASHAVLEEIATWTISRRENATHLISEEITAHVIPEVTIDITSEEITTDTIPEETTGTTSGENIALIIQDERFW